MSERKNEEIAAFRFGVIHEFVTGANMTMEEKKRLLQAKCERKWIIPYSSRTRISRNTIYRWIRYYRKAGGNIHALHPQPRNDCGKSRRLDDEAVCSVIRSRKQQPELPVAMLL